MVLFFIKNKFDLLKKPSARGHRVTVRCVYRHSVLLTDPIYELESKLKHKYGSNK